MRQHALATGIAADGKYELVVSTVAFDDRNDTLRDSLRSTGLGDFADWGDLFHGAARFATFTHQEWVKWIRDKSPDPWREWLRYVEERYDL